MGIYSKFIENEKVDKTIFSLFFDADYSFDLHISFSKSARQYSQ